MCWDCTAVVDGWLEETVLPSLWQTLAGCGALQTHVEGLRSASSSSVWRRDVGLEAWYLLPVWLRNSLKASAASARSRSYQLLASNTLFLYVAILPVASSTSGCICERLFFCRRAMRTGRVVSQRALYFSFAPHVASVGASEKA